MLNILGHPPHSCVTKEKLGVPHTERCIKCQFASPPNKAHDITAVIPTAPCISPPMLTNCWVDREDIFGWGSKLKVPQKYIKVHKSTKNLCVWNLIILLKHWKKMRTSLKQSYGKAPVTDLDPRIFLCLLHLYVVDLHLWKTVLSWLIYANLWWIYQVSSKFVPKLIVLIITALYILELTRSPCQNEVALKITVTYHLPEYLWLNLNSYRPDVTTIKAF